MLDSLFQFLFEYPPVVFRQGEFRLAPAAGAYAALALAIVAVVFAVLSYRRAAASSSTGRRALAGLLAIRIALIALLAFCLFRPVLVVKAAMAQQNFLAVLLDDSRSMQIADFTSIGRPRGDFSKQEFGDRNAGLLKALSDKFVVRTFRFSSAAARLGSTSELTFGGVQTRIGAALDGARQELAGLPLAGVVLVSDGADTTDAALTDAVLSLKAAALPVFTVGVGRDRLTRDIQVDRVSAPRQALKGTSLLIDVVVRQTGYSGETISVDVEDGGRIIGTQEVKLTSDGEPTSVRVRVMAADAGARVFKFKVSPRVDEVIAQNNVREALVDIVDRPERILYYEGTPRFELRFLRKAVNDDKNLQVVTLVRTAESKYFRSGVDDAEQLTGGFPKTREELFSYRGLILGSVEASAFTADQLRMISDFVEKRGGGLLVLGGRKSFTEGGYAGTPVADVLPVVLDRVVRAADVSNTPPIFLQIRPTRAGGGHAVTQIAPNEAGSLARWPEMPPLSTVNPVRSVKPGATVLLGGMDDRRRDLVVLASQRYGRGKAIAHMVQDSWVWQMHAKMSVADQTHENYWRQMLRWLVDGVPDTVDVHTVSDRVEPGETVTVVADVVDRSFVELNDAKVTAHVRRPGGGVEDVPMHWTGERSGEYRATFTATEAGIYKADVEALRGATAVGRSATQVRAVPSDAEYFDATMQAGRLKRIADDTGGKFYEAESSAGLPEDLQYTGRGVTTIEERELWHMPIVLIAMLGLMFGEWSLRRRAGLA
ncbi:MAG: glutamine amidotransferase [Vicinamibacterales bacterium]